MLDYQGRSYAVDPRSQRKLFKRPTLEASTMAATELRGAADIFRGDKSKVKVTQIVGHTIESRGLQVISELQSDLHQIVVRWSSGHHQMVVRWSSDGRQMVSTFVTY